MPMSQAEIDAVAARVREGGTPDFLNRWLELTPELIARNEEFLARLRAEERRRNGVSNEETMATLGRKEAQTRALREAGESEAAAATRRAMTDAVDGPKKTGATPAEVAGAHTLASRMTDKDLTFQIENAAKLGVPEALTRIFREEQKRRADLAAQDSQRAQGVKRSLTEVAAGIECTTRTLLAGVPPRSARKSAQEADAAELAMIGQAVSFNTRVFDGGKWLEYPRSDLAAARAIGEEMERTTGSSRKAMVYAVLADGRAVLVPRDFQPAPATEKGNAMTTTTTTPTTTKPAPAPVPPKAAAKPAAPAAPAKPAQAKGDAAGKPKPAAKKAAAKTAKAEKPAKAKKPNKSDLVHQMLTSAKGATREELSKATGWPHVNLKVAAERADMILKEDGDRFRLVAKKGAAAAAPAKA